MDVLGVRMGVSFTINLTQNRPSPKRLKTFFIYFSSFLLRVAPCENNQQHSVDKLKHQENHLRSDLHIRSSLFTNIIQGVRESRVHFMETWLVTSKLLFTTFV